MIVTTDHCVHRMISRRCGMRLRVTIVVGIFSTVAFGAEPVHTTLNDFFQAGSQPTSGVQYEPFRPSNVCAICHQAKSGQDLVIKPPWDGSMMAQSARDPVFHAALTIANQDADFAGDLCLRCHTPGGWIAGRSEPSDGSMLTDIDRDGVNCTVCHRMVNPVFDSLLDPPADEAILMNIDPLPVRPGGANFIFDPLERFRGPYDNISIAGHAVAHSPYMRTAAMCGTCHDIGNPVYVRQPDDTYTLTNLDEPHPTGDLYDMFPVERTYSEWLNSAFANGGVDMHGRFGGNQSVVSTCQDCHMPKVTDYGCAISGVPLRNDLPAHDLAGGNAWVQDMILNLYPDDGLDPARLEAGKQRAISMLTRASTLEVTQTGNRITVRVINETGHKLPTGYPEGRRMWINVEVLDESLQLLDEHGYYNPLTADLTTDDTKVYEIQLGIDASVAAATGIPEGKSFHFAINNVIFMDNRIPPRGFTNAAYRLAAAPPVKATYADGQYWDDTVYRLPSGARFVTVRLMYQTSSKEYITFLRDENRTNSAGDDLYDQWELTGMSPPVQMAETSITLGPFADGDFDGNRFITLDDYFALQAYCFSGPDVAYNDPDCIALDFDADGDVDLNDVNEFDMMLTN